MATATTIFPKHVVEGMLGQYLASLKESLDCLYDPDLTSQTTLSFVDNIKATFAIAEHDTHKALLMLEPYSDFSLCEKHRFFRDCMKEFQVRLKGCEGIREAKRTNNKRIILFAKEITEFLTAGHKVLSENTTSDDRVTTVQEYVGECPELAHRLPGKSKIAGMILDTSAKSI
jgi:hypothetical protein